MPHFSPFKLTLFQCAAYWVQGWRLWFMFLWAIASYGQESEMGLRINEILASNVLTNEDEDGDAEDWVEIYNPTDLAIDLAGMYFTNDPGKPAKWRIPESSPDKTTVPPQGYVLFWFDKEPNEGANHINTKLSRKGAYLGLISPDGVTLVDSLEFGWQALDVSYGRQPDGGDQWTHFLKPSPLGKNGVEELISSMEKSPEFSVDEGFFDRSITLDLDTDERGTIYYTTNGAVPDKENRILYQKTLVLNETTVVRALVVRKGQLQSRIKTKTFFVAERSSLPVVSLVVDPYWLYDADDGIYQNWEDDWEVPGHVEYFESTLDSASSFSSNVGVSISGNSTKEYAKKSFSLHFQSGWGKEEIQYSLWKDKPQVNKFNGLTLRADMAGSRLRRNPKAGERIKNELIYQFNREMGKHVDIQAYRSVSLFLNGKYWGVYTLMERKGLDFIRQNHGFDKIDMLAENKRVIIHGDDTHFVRLQNFVETRNLNNPVNYRQVLEWMDMASFIDYWIYEVYCGAHDHDVNIRYWRPRTPDGKWRWLSFDMDSWTTWDHDIIHYYLGSDETVLLLPELFQCTEFLHQFGNRMCDNLNTVMRPENTKRLVREITHVIEHEITRERERWKIQHRFEDRGAQVAWFMEYADKRPNHMRDEFIRYFKLDGEPVLLNLNVRGKGGLKVNTITPKRFPWQGTYLSVIPIRLEAIPEKGHRFVGWTDPNLEQSPQISVMPKEGMTLTALFEKVQQKPPSITREEE